MRPANETVVQVDLTDLTEEQARDFLKEVKLLIGDSKAQIETLEPDYDVGEDGRLTKDIIAYGKHLVLECDGKCHKAWGSHARPKHHFVDPEVDYDDYEYLADQELGEAPANPGTYEGGHGKPRHFMQKLNKWCFRECERSFTDTPGAPLLDFSVRRPNDAKRTPTPVPK